MTSILKRCWDPVCISNNALWVSKWEPKIGKLLTIKVVGGKKTKVRMPILVWRTHRAPSNLV